MDPPAQKPGAAPSFRAQGHPSGKGRQPPAHGPLRARGKERRATMCASPLKPCHSHPDHG